jgi:hypothetical protein
VWWSGPPLQKVGGPRHVWVRELKYVGIFDFEIFFQKICLLGLKDFFLDSGRWERIFFLENQTYFGGHPVKGVRNPFVKEIFDFDKKLGNKRRERRNEEKRNAGTKRGNNGMRERRTGIIIHRLCLKT